MAFLAKIGATFLFIFGSLWSGTLGVLHISHNTATSTQSTYFAGVSQDNSQISETSVKNTDTVQFTLSNGWRTPFSKDKEHVYLSTGQVDQNENPVPSTVISGADPSTFTLIGAVGGDVIYGYYAKDANRVYYTDNGVHGIVVLQNANPDTFALVPITQGGNGIAVQFESCGIGCTYDAQDKNHKYLNGQMVQENSQTSATTTILDDQGKPSLQTLGNGFATDGNFIYAYSDFTDEPTRLTNVDAKTFRPECPQIDNSSWGCDATHLVSSFFASVVSGEYDLASLQGLGGGYYIDKKNIYRIYHGNFMGTVAGADMGTFVVIKDDKFIDARDKNQTYFCGKKYDPNDTVRACY